MTAEALGTKLGEMTGVSRWRQIRDALAQGEVTTILEQLGREVAGDGIRVCGVKPGLIDTEIHGDIGGADRVAQLASTVPIGRAGSAEEVAECILWLCSDHASYVTATSFDVAGGR